MENFLPLFPLKIVVFPGEQLNLHIFEPRYKQLISDCLEQKVRFGIPAYINEKIEYGTEVEILEVVKKYEDGRFDITTRGLRPFKVREYENPLKGKLYAAGVVDFVENLEDEDEQVKEKMLELTRELFLTLNIVKDVHVAHDSIAFDLAHKVGMNLQEEYQLLQVPSENARQQLVIQHLQKAIPILRQVEETKAKIKMNGHFRYFDPLNF
jgi:Lon protease-like protein